MAVHARWPYLDEDVLAPGTFVGYYVHVLAEAAANTLANQRYLLGPTT